MFLIFCFGWFLCSVAWRSGCGGGVGIGWGGFFRLAGAEGVEDSPFAGAAAEGGWFQAAEGEFHLVPDVQDDAVRFRAQEIDVRLFAFEGVLGGGLEGELGVRRFSASE